MANFFASLKAVLVADSTLGALTTLIKDDEDVGRDGLQRKDLLASATATSISPALFIKWRSRLPQDLLLFNQEQIFLEIFFYQEKGYTTCEAMRNRVLTLLHRQSITFDVGFCLEIYWRGDILRSFDPAMEGVSMERSRYEARVTRD